MDQLLGYRFSEKMIVAVRQAFSRAASRMVLVGSSSCFMQSPDGTLGRIAGQFSRNRDVPKPLGDQKLEISVVSVKRNRSRPPGSLQERLLATAKLARRRAEEAPEGEERKRLLRKAELTERSAKIEAWLAPSVSSKSP
ncbi:hypothetical protein [Bradyrhizobium japonicum]|uniref:hypothetical protein n=1 Tax=Bradyrhizobium japonicum TaxID=375 RepID=UPI0020119B4F|nr:hypothetical protein [Bradyrhizobium japonicum]